MCSASIRGSGLAGGNRGYAALPDGADEPRRRLRQRQRDDAVGRVPRKYNARCRRSGTASWLQITPIHIPGDHRPIVRALLGPGWGLHLTDVDIALADLVRVVGDESQAFTRARSARSTK